MNALRKLTQEEKDGIHKYRAGAVINFLPLDKVNLYFSNTPKPLFPKEWIINQGEYDPMNDECAGISGSIILTLMNGYRVGFNTLWMFARQRAGDKITDYGLSLVDLAQTMVAIGAERWENETFPLSAGRDIIQDPTKYPPLQPIKLRCAEQAIGAFLWAKPQGKLDSYDVARSAIATLNTLFPDKKHGCVFGMLWGYPMTDVYIDVPSDSGNGHAIPLYWETNSHLNAIQSYGLEAGNQGEQMIARAVFNKWAEDFGCFIPIDATRAQIDALIASGSKFNDPWRVNIVRRFVDAYKGLKKPFSWLVAVLEMFLNNKKVGGMMLWDTKEHCRRNVRVIADRYGLSWSQKATLCATIRHESNYNTKAVCVNKDTNGKVLSTDRGICQWNDYWHGKEITADEAFNNPEKAVDLMCQYWKRGQMDQWVAYSSGAFKRYLAVESLPSTPY